MSRNDISRNGKYTDIYVRLVIKHLPILHFLLVIILKKIFQSGCCIFNKKYAEIVELTMPISFSWRHKILDALRLYL